MDDQNALDKLCHEIGVDPEASAEEIKAGLIAWLYEGDSSAPPPQKNGGASPPAISLTVKPLASASMPPCVWRISPMSASAIW